MGFISFFRTPKPRKFEFTPRFYDPIKEEIEERTAQIRREMGLNEEDANKKENNIARKERIRMNFRNTSRDNSHLKSGGMGLRAIIITWLTVTLFGYLYGGNQVLYLMLILGVGYVYWYFRKKNSNI